MCFFVACCGGSAAVCSCLPDVAGGVFLLGSIWDICLFAYRSLCALAICLFTFYVFGSYFLRSLMGSVSVLMCVSCSVFPCDFQCFVSFLFVLFLFGALNVMLPHSSVVLF